MDDHHVVTQELNDLNNEQLMKVGGALGLYHPHLERMKNLLPDMVASWLRKDDNVSQPPTWASLATALKAVGHTGVASGIRKSNTCS